MRFGIKSTSLLVCIRLTLAISFCVAGFYLYILCYTTFAEYVPLRSSQELHLIDIVPYYLFMTFPVSVMVVFISMRSGRIITLLLTAGIFSQWQNHSLASEPLIALCAAVQCSFLMLFNRLFYQSNT